jgi:hypothetical protein
VERELRCKERQLREAREELEKAEALNEAFQRELCALRQGNSPRPAVRESSRSDGPELLPQPKPGPAKPPQAAPAVQGPIKEIVLARGTGGYSEGRGPADDSLQVVVEPRDTDGHSLKVLGCLHVTALEILPGGVKKPLSSWEVSVAELRRNWKSGLFSTGYYVVLPWKCPPSTEKLRVVVQFTTADGRLYEADKDVTIRLPPASQGKPAADHIVEKPVQPIAAWQAPPLNEAVRLLRPE